MADSRSVLARVGDTMHYYPLDEIQVNAGAPSGTDAETLLAMARLRAVRAVLESHGHKSERVRTTVLEGGGQAGVVDIVIVGN